jgi:hypothetical protein
VEQLLGDYLATSVAITVGSSPGKLVIDFADLADLDRIYRQIVSPASYE